MDAADDATLLARWRDGDRGAGEALFARHFDCVFGFFETKCEAEADELTQATFLACLRAREGLGMERGFSLTSLTSPTSPASHRRRTREF